jgi:type I restriction enzyme M protein
MRNMCVLAIVGLGRNTFLPHTHQKAGILFARKPDPAEPDPPEQEIFFAISQRDGKDSRGRPILRAGPDRATPAWTRLDHDLNDIALAYDEFRAARNVALGV